MDCPTEERLIRNRLEAMAGVVRLDFNLLERRLNVHHRLADPAAISAALHALDMAPSELDAAQPTPPVAPAISRRLGVLLAISGLAAIAAESLAWFSGQENTWPVMALALLSIASSGLPTLKKGWIALKNLTLNIYFLMSLAVAGALLIGKYPEASMVVFLFALAEAIEALSLQRARNAHRFANGPGPGHRRGTDARRLASAGGRRGAPGQPHSGAQRYARTAGCAGGGRTRSAGPGADHWGCCRTSRRVDLL